MNRKINVIYCDDIRQEVGNKQSFIGVYSARLIVPEFPTTLPKLCLAVTIDTPVTEPFSSLTLKIYQDDQVLLEVPIDIGPQANAIKDSIALGNDAPRIGLNTTFVLSPFVIEKSCWLKVRAETESGEIRGNSLKIEAAPIQ